MVWTKNGYRYPPCVVCQVAVEMKIRDNVVAGRCRIRGIGDVCSFHFHMMHGAMKLEGEPSS
jgi:hypothetical protein